LIGSNLWENKDTILTGDVRQAPWIGDSAAKHLAEHEKITSIWQYFGKYLELGRDDDAFKEMLKAAGVAPGNVVRATDAVKKRMLGLGFEVAVPLPEHLLDSSRMNDESMDWFVKAKVSQDLTEAFRGLGVKANQNLSKAGVKTTDQLFAKLLSYCDAPAPSQKPEKTEEFYYWMRDDAKVEGGWVPTIIDQLAAKLRVGIDHGVDLDPRTS